ncbi:MAG: GNAT family N-acetyltransferase [Rhodospirillales bacterium]|nr:GNAT family N-acetyltransferase [Rhodospirillales bacterium]
MTSSPAPNPVLPAGYSPLPPGMLANVVTFLEMTAAPPPRAASAQAPDSSLTVARWHAPPLDAYRALFRAVGQEWMWVSRLLMPDDTLRAALDDPAVEVYALVDRGGRQLGLIELDFRKSGECELVYFGVVPEAIGTGAGRLMMEEAIRQAWCRPIRRFWVHTCTFDHPGAVAFYIRSGFRPYQRQVEVHEDPRLTGKMPRDAAPHIPIIGQ